MPRPGSHHYDTRRARLRAQHDDSGTPDQHADAAANEELQRDNPPMPLGDPERAAGPAGVGGDSRGTRDTDDDLAAPGGVVLRSTAFVDHDLIPSHYATPSGPSHPRWNGPRCRTTPPSSRSSARMPTRAASSTGVVAGIPPSASGVPEGRLPGGAVTGRNDGGELGWAPPHPPVGDDPHRDRFRLLVLDESLGLDQGVTADELRVASQGHELATGTLVGRFGR